MGNNLNTPVWNPWSKSYTYAYDSTFALQVGITLAGTSIGAPLNGLNVDPFFGPSGVTPGTWADICGAHVDNFGIYHYHVAA